MHTAVFFGLPFNGLDGANEVSEIMGLYERIVSKGRGAASWLPGMHLPLSLTLVSTYRCGYSCSYCGVSSESEGELSTFGVVCMINEFCSMGLKAINISGGEPLLRPDIGRLVNYCKERGLITTISTNGELLKDRLQEIAYVDRVVVGFDGPPEVQNSQRKASSYEQVLDGIRAARDAGLNVSIQTVVTKNNVDAARYMVEKAARLGVPISFRPVLYYPGRRDENKIKGLAADSDALNNFASTLRDMDLNGDAGVSFPSAYLDALDGRDSLAGGRRCKAGRLYCAVSPTGEVAPCSALIGTGSWTNGIDKGFEKAFAKLKSFKCERAYCASVETDLPCLTT